MGVRFDQLISLPELKALKLVSGSKGIHKIVRWVHVIETPDLLQYVQSDELVILTGVAVSNNIQAFIDLVEGLIEKNVVGLIVNVGKYFDKVPDEINKIADANDFSILELPWEISIAEITKTICEEVVRRHMEEVSYQDLLMNTIFFNKISQEDFNKRISDLGYSSINSFRIAIVSLDNLQEYLTSKNIKDEKNIIHIKDIFFNSVNSAVSDSRSRPISYLQNNSVILLLINEKGRYANLNILSEIIRESCKNNFPDNSVSIAMGNVYTEFSQIKKSYLEAEKALKVIKAEGKSDETVYYSNIGAYKLITEIENSSLLKEYYYDTLGKLEQYDLQNHTDFTAVLNAFLQENGSYIQAAQRLYMHRNTLMYKINKIQELIKMDLSDPKVRFECYLGFLVKKTIDY
jgi:sugar diacid utilization regulator